MSDCRLLALAPEGVRDLEAAFPNFGKLHRGTLAHLSRRHRSAHPARFRRRVASRRARAQQGRHRRKRRSPDEEDQPVRGREAASSGKTPPHPPKSRTSSRSTRWIAARRAWAMICRHFGRNVSLARIRQLCHTATRRHEPQGALPRGDRARPRGARAEGLAAQSSIRCRCPRSCTGKAITGWCSTTSTRRTCAWTIPASARAKFRGGI